MTSHIFSCRPTPTLRSIRFNKILRDGKEMNDLLAFLLWPLALYVWSLSLNLWRAAWGNRQAELTEAEVVPLWQLACFPPLSVVWSIDDSGRTNKIESHCMVWMQCAVHWACTLGMHCMLSRELNKSDAYVDNVWQMCRKAKEISYSSYQTLYFDQHSNMSSSKLLHRV